MAQTIKLKRSATQGATPTTSQLALGEVAINTYDGKMYIKKDVGGTESIVEIGTGSGGSGLASSFTLYEYTATASQTTFSGSDDNSNSLEYDTDTPPKVLVYLNGVLLDFTTDYTATSGTSVVLTTGAAAGDLVQVAAYKSTVSTTLDIDLTDNQKLLLGTDDDLQIYHDGTNSIIADEGGGDLIFKAYDDFYFKQATDDANILRLNTGGDATFYGTISSGAITSTGAIKTDYNDTIAMDYAPASGDYYKGMTGTSFNSAATARGLHIFNFDNDSNLGINFWVGTNASKQFAARIDDTGKVGIGTASPVSNLHVKTSVDNSVAQGLVIERSANSDRGYINYNGGGFQFRSTVGDPIVFGETDAEHMRILPDGNVGIGTSSPATKLNVKHTGGTGVRIETDGDTDSNFLHFKTSSGTGQGYIGTEGSTAGANFTGTTAYAFVAGSTSSGVDTQFLSAGAVRATIDHTGKVGIGTSSPGYPLEISGEGTVSLAYQRTGTGVTAKKWGFHSDNSNTYWQNITDSLLAVTVSNAGNVGIGVTNPGQTLEIHNSNASDYTDFALRGTGHKYVIGVGNDSVATVNDKWYLYDNDNTAFRMVVDTSGNVGIGTTSPASLYSTASQLVIGDGSAEVGMTIYTPSTGAGRIFFADGLSSGAQYAGFISYNHANQEMLFGTGGTGTTDVTINQYGNVGIGTTSPDLKLDVSHGTTSEYVATFQNTADNLELKIGTITGGLLNIQGATVNNNTAYNIGLQAEGGNVGIGTASPTEKFHVEGNVRLSGSIVDSFGEQLNFQSNDLVQFGKHIRAEYGLWARGATTRAMGIDGSNGYMGLYTNTTEKVRIDSSGNVGIGTTSPDAPLAIHNSSLTSTSFDGSGGLRVHRPNAFGQYGWFEYGYNSDTTFIGSKYSGGTSTSYGQIWFAQDSNGGTRQYPLVIDGSGNVGIGTSSPAAKLDVQIASAGIAQYVYNTGSSQAYINFANATTGRYSQAFGTPGGLLVGVDTDETSIVWNGSNTALRFGTNSTERMRIDSSGRALINLTGPVASSSAKLQVSNTAAPVVMLNRTNSGDVVTFHRDGTSATGTISVNSGYIGVGAGAVYLGYYTDGSNNKSIIPMGSSTGSAAAGTIGLGINNPNHKFKDAWITGAVNAASLNIDGGTIKLDADYPTSTNNFAAGNGALDAITTGIRNTTLGSQSGVAITSGGRHTFVGYASGYSTTTSSYNTAIGSNSLQNATTASNNTAVGFSALTANTTGGDNVAIGLSALRNNTTANQNTAVGFRSLHNSTTGGLNTAIGRMALYHNTTGQMNVAIGYNAMYLSNVDGYNTAVGANSLSANTTGTQNVAVGYRSLATATTGGNSTAIGFQALSTATTATDNVAVGSGAGFAITTGSNNTAIGTATLDANTTASNNTAVGTSALTANTTGSRNTGLGYNAGDAITTGLNNTAIGADALSTNQTGSHNVAIGRAAMQGGGTAVIGNVAIGIDSLESNNADYNVAIGYRAAQGNTTGIRNTVLGTEALEHGTIYSDTTALGYKAIEVPSRSNASTSQSTAVGSFAGACDSATTAPLNDNTFVGYLTGRQDALTTGNHSQNTGLGRGALRQAASTVGSSYFNTAVGVEALAMNGNTTQNTLNNTAVGDRALVANQGSNNTAIGRYAGQNNSTGSANTYIGYEAGKDITTGSYNTIIGHFSGNQNGLDIRTTSNYIVFSDGSGAPRGWFTNSGHFLVGTTAYNAADGNILQANGEVFSTIANNLNSYHLYDITNNAFRFYVSGGGQIHATSTSITAISDQSLKENIRDLDKGLNTILSLQPRRFDWKNGDGNDIMGFIAQEVEQVMPEIVHETKYTDEETKLGLKMGDMIPSLVKAIQELKTELDAAKARIATLESQ